MMINEEKYAATKSEILSWVENGVVWVTPANALALLEEFGSAYTTIDFGEEAFFDYTVELDRGWLAIELSRMAKVNEEKVIAICVDSRQRLTFGFGNRDD